MNIEASNQREQYFAEYFNLRKKKKEFSEIKKINLPKNKKYFSKIRRYFTEDHSDLKMSASDLFRYNGVEKKFNIGAKFVKLNYSMDGVDKSNLNAQSEDEDKLNAGELLEDKWRKGGMDISKLSHEEALTLTKKWEKESWDAFNKRMKSEFRKQSIRSMLQIFGVLGSSVFAIFAAIIFFVLLILTMMMWLFGAM